jgi:hypothetical protein
MPSPNKESRVGKFYLGGGYKYSYRTVVWEHYIPASAQLTTVVLSMPSSREKDGGHISGFT